ncbi:hypothetical protein Daus18300_011087 [Diaporthe australafricana]|uniref:NAD(P)-binding domain-containing protein n=1 Tax=Diaporthe australafricana TaxID=127596 RepID=A0ABR3W800_9PEZI
MPSHITVIPASTQAGAETIRTLLESPNEPVVRGIYRDLHKAPVEFTENPRFEATKGDVGTGTGLDFDGSNAVSYIPPPTYDGTHHDEFATRTANAIANALQRAQSVNRLLLHSAVGTHYDPDTIGILRLNISDRILKEAAPDVIIVSIKDIGECCAKTLLREPTGQGLLDVKLLGPRLYSSLDIKDAIESVTGKKGRLVTIPRGGLADYWAKLIPEAYVQEFVDFTTAQLSGGTIAQDHVYLEDTIRCKRDLVDDLREMVSP